MSNLLRRAEQESDMASMKASKQMRKMTNHIRRKIFKINEQLQTDVPRSIASQAMNADRQNRLKQEILKRAPE